MEPDFPRLVEAETMKFWQHFMFSNVFVFLILFLPMPMLCNTLPSTLFIVVMAGPTFADLDLKLGSHRNWFFHSSFPIALSLGFAFISSTFMDVGFFAVSHGIHLICDLKIGKNTKRGTYLVHWRKGNRASVKQTDTWLLLHGAICILVGLVAVAYG
jgi:hypothetical protein